jgi:hypothetical protein
LDTPGSELGGKAAGRTTILSGGVVTKTLRGSAGFFVDGGFNAMTEPDFFPCFYTVLLFGFYPAKERIGAGSVA